MQASVICAACGARIRADRQWCLRCGEALQPPSAASPASSTKGMTKGSILMIGAVGSLTLLIVVAMWLQSKSFRNSDTAQPASNAAASAMSHPSTVPQSSSSSQSRTTGVSSSGDVPATVAALEPTRASGAGAPSNDLQNARQEFERTLLKKPNDPESLNGLGLVLVRLERLDDAAGCFTRAIQAAPTTWAYHFNLAHTEGLLEKWDRAAAEYRVAVDLLPRDYATQYNLASALHKAGNDQAAVPEYQRAIQLVPDDPGFHLSLAVSLERINKLEDAEREYRQYLRLSPSSPDAEKLKAHIQTLRTGAPAERRAPIAAS